MSQGDHTKGGLPRIGTIILIALLLLAINMLFLSFGEYPEDNEIRVAVLMPFTSSMSEFGIEYGRGVSLAIDELNRHVLPGGRTYVADFYDTEGEAVSLLNTFLEIYNSGYPVVIGPVTSTEMLTIAKYAEILGIVLISPAATSDELSQYDEYVFRTVSSDRYLSMGVGKIVGSNDHLQTVMVMHTDNSYGKGLADLFVEELAVYGKDVAAFVEIPTDPRYAFDEDAAIALMKEVQPDAVFGMMSSAAQFVSLLEKADAAGITTQWIVTDTAASSDVLAAGSISEGVLAAVPSKKATSTSYERMYEAKYHAPMKIHDSVYGYDTMMMVAEAISSSGYTPQEIRDGLREIKYVGLSGAIVFDEQGDRYPVYDVMQVRDGKWVILPWAEIMTFEEGGHH